MPTIVDVGARGGLHPRWESAPYPVQGLLFEPEPIAAQELRTQFSNNADGPSVRVFETALSEREETLTLNVFRFGGASSIYDLNYREANRYYANTEKFDVVERVELRARPLDDVLFENEIDHVDALKIDTQGSELSILKGARRLLERIVCVEVEVEFRPIYENQPLFPEVNEFVSSYGFELYDLGRCFRTRNECREFGDRRGQLVWGDGLYFKAPEVFMNTPHLTEKQILGAFQTYLIYGYPDSAQVLLTAADDQIGDATRKEMMENLSALRREPFKRTPGIRLKRMIRQLASNVVEALSEEHAHSFKRDSELGNHSQKT